MNHAISQNTYKLNLKAIQLVLKNFPVTVDNQSVRRKFRSKCYTKFDWLKYSASKYKAKCGKCSSVNHLN